MIDEADWLIYNNSYELEPLTTSGTKRSTTKSFKFKFNAKVFTSNMIFVALSGTATNGVPSFIKAATG